VQLILGQLHGAPRNKPIEAGLDSTV
jgi:hypothetical protein